MQTTAFTPGLSLLRISAPTRLGIALALSALLWLLTWIVVS